MKAVLIADDEAAIRLLVTATVKTEDVEVLQAVDGHEARALIQERRPAVAILDWQMPGPNGLELCAWIKADPELASTKVIILTARAQNDDKVAGEQAGADLYLTKPFSPLTLKEAVERALG